MFDGNLTDAETALTLAAVHGEYGGAGADRPESEWPVIRAEVIRRLLLGQAVFQNGERMSAVPLVSGVRARGIRIDGPLDLTDARWPDGGPVQPLILEGATLAKLIAPHAHIARLSLKNVRFSHIDLDGADIGSDLQIDDGRALAEGGECYISARNARIDGSLSLRRTKLKRAARAEPSPEEPVQYALDLNGSVVEGTLTFYPALEADGGVRLADARIEGDVWMVGARLVRGEGYALNAQSTRIGGSFTARNLDRSSGGYDRFTAAGGISLWGIRIGGGLYMDGAYLDGMTHLDNPDIEGDALIVSGGEIGAGAGLGYHQSKGEAGHPFEAKGSIWFNDAKFGRGVDLSGARINADVGPAISFKDATIAGSLSLATSVQRGGAYRTELRGQLDLSAASIGAIVDVSGARLDGAGAACIVAQATKIGSAFIGNTYSAADTALPFEAIGPIDLLSSHIKGGVSLQGAQIKADPDAISLRAINATIGQDFLCGCHMDGETIIPFTCEGTIGLSGAKIGGDVGFYGSKLSGKGASLTAVGANIGGGLHIEAALRSDGIAVRAEIRGPVSLASISVSGGTLLTGVFITSEAPNVAALDLTSAKLEHVLHIGPTHDAQGRLVYATEILGGLRMWGTRVSGRTEIGDALIDGDAAIVARELDVTGDLQLGDTKLKGPCDLRSATIGGQVSVKNVTLINDMAPHPVLARLDEPAVIACIEECYKLSVAADLELRDYEAFFKRFFSKPRAIDAETFGLLASCARTTSIDLSEATLGRTLIVDELLVEDTVAYAKLPREYQRPDIRLTAAKTDTLQDLGGAGWGEDVDLTLDGFRYNHITGLGAKRNGRPRRLARLFRRRAEPGVEAESKRELQDRLAWLNLQYYSRRPLRSNYRSQPYEQVAKVLGAQGDSHGAKAVLRHKLSIEGRFLPLVLRPFYWTFGALFGYGLAARRSIATLLAYVLIGTLLVQIALHRGQLAIDSTHTTTVAVGGHQTTPATLMPTLDTIACGDEIAPWIFAVDVAAPLLDLGEERRCTFRAPRGSDPVLFSLPAIDLAKGAPSLFTWNEVSEPMLWRWGRAIYALLGLLVTSLVVLTVTGVFRRAAER